MGCEPPPYNGFHSPRSLAEAIGALARRQHGVVSGAQLVELGLTPRAIEARLRNRRLYRLHRGVYAVGHMALTSRSRDLAAVLAYGPEALLSHRSAADLWRLRRTSSARIEVTAPRARTPRKGITLHRSRVIHPDDRAVVDGIPVTSVARTLVDLADVLTEPRLSDAVNEAEVLRCFDLRAIEAALGRLPTRRGRHRLQRVLAAYRPEPQFTRSATERRLLRICREHGLPMPATSVWIAGQEIDLYWSDVRLGIEYDGADFHQTRRAFHEDRRRDRRLAAIGIQVNRITWPDLADEAGLAAELKRIRAERSGQAAA